MRPETASSSLVAYEMLQARKAVWPGELHLQVCAELHGLSELSVVSFHRGASILDGRWYVTHAGLLGWQSPRDARNQHCLVKQLSDPRFRVAGSSRRRSINRLDSRGFVGYGDADPSNVSSLVRGRRDARCRNSSRQPRSAKSVRNRPCSVEELGSLSLDRFRMSIPSIEARTRFPATNGSNNGQPRLARPTLPSDSPAQPRSHAREGLRR